MIKSSISTINTKAGAKKTSGSKYSLKPPKALAYWFQDDGSYRTRKAKRYYVLNTQSFIFEDQQTLVQSLKDNF